MAVPSVSVSFLLFLPQRTLFLDLGLLGATPDDFILRALITPVRTPFLDKVTVTGSRGEHVDLSFRGSQFKPTLT